VPRLTLLLPSGAAREDVQVTLDGAELAGSALGVAQLVDPGPHSIEYTVAGTKKTRVVPLERGGASEITLDVPAKKLKTVTTVTTLPPVHHVPPPQDHRGHGQRVAGVLIGGAGLTAIGVSAYLALSARSQYHDALSQHCMNATDMCDGIGLSRTHDARHQANVATVVFSIGAATVTTGVVVYLVAPHGKPIDEHALYLTPALDRGGVSLVLGGRL
jgi:hypothetical protein